MLCNVGNSKVCSIGSKEKTEVYSLATLCKQCAQVCYYSEEEVEKALELNSRQGPWLVWACGHVIMSPKYLRSYNERI